ncbi:hypothetical protein Tco_0494029 [Tanacetum coccineum]
MITTPESWLYYTAMIMYTAYGVVKLLAEVPYDLHIKYLERLHGGGVNPKRDGVTLADKEKPIEDSKG